MRNLVLAMMVGMLWVSVDGSRVFADPEKQKTGEQQTCRNCQMMTGRSDPRETSGKGGSKPQKPKKGVAPSSEGVTAAGGK